MILGIDASQANRKVRSGTEWYAFYLIQEFKKLIGGRGDIRVRLYLRDEPQADLAANLPENWEVKILHWPFKYFWGQIRLSWEMLMHPPDILFCPAHTIPLIHPHPLSISPYLPSGDRGRRIFFSPSRRERGEARGGRTFTTLHDIGFEDYPELYDKFSLWYHRWAARLAVKKAYHIFTISEFSKERIVENYNSPPPSLTLREGVPPLKVRGGKEELSNKITVTYLAIDTKLTAVKNESILEHHNLVKNNYLLFVGRLEPKKNILGMVKAYEQYLQSPSPPPSPPSRGEGERVRGQVPNLVLAGRKVRTEELDEYLVSRPELKNKVKFLGYFDEQDKGALYAGARIFLFPTLYEGFGLPILEAQAAGTPVITSNTASNPEIAGKGAVIVDPESPYEIAETIKKLLDNHELRAEKIRQGHENVKRFSWEDTAKKTLEKLLS